MSRSDVSEIHGALWTIVAMLGYMAPLKWVMWVGIVCAVLSLLGSILSVDTQKPNSTLLAAIHEHNKRI